MIKSVTKFVSISKKFPYLSVQTSSKRENLAVKKMPRLNSSQIVMKNLTFMNLQRFCKSDDYTEKAGQLIQKAQSQTRKGNYQEALNHYQRSYEIIQAREGRRSSNGVLVLKAIAILHCYKKQYTQAIKQMKLCERIFEEIYLKPEISLVEFYRDFGSVYTHTQNYVEALKYFEKALDNMITLDGGQTSISSVPLLITMAQIYFQNDEIEKAKKLFTKCEQILTKYKEESGDSAVKVMKYLAQIYKKVGDSQIALEYLEKLQKIEKIIEKPEKQQSITELYAQGVTHAQNKQIQKALGKFQRSLELEKKKSGQQSKIVMSTYFKIGNQLEALGYFKHALTYLKQCLNLVSKIQPNTMQHAVVSNQMAVIMQQLGLYSQAKSKALESLSVYEKIHPNGCELMTFTLDCLSIISSSQPDGIQEAIEYRKRSIEVLYKVTGTYNSQKMLQNFFFLALQYHLLGEMQKSLSYFSSAHEVSLVVFGKGHQQTNQIEQFMSRARKANQKK